MGGLQDLVVSMALAQLALGNAGSAGAAGDGDQAHEEPLLSPCWSGDPRQLPARRERTAGS